jgi:hypothetical protein
LELSKYPTKINSLEFWSTYLFFLLECAQKAEIQTLSNGSNTPCLHHSKLARDFFSDNASVGDLFFKYTSVFTASAQYFVISRDSITIDFAFMPLYSK